MTNHIETQIDKITDKDFQIMFSELCICANFQRDEFNNKTMANFISALITEHKKLDLGKVAIEQILNKKFKKLDINSVVHGVCCELAIRKEKNLDSIANKTVFMIFKQCHAAIVPKSPRTKKLTSFQTAYQFKTMLIDRRRKNGSL